MVSEDYARSAIPLAEKTVAIFGAGIAGLSAAHEFVKRGWTVSVYEPNPDAGGFFRSARVAGNGNMPTEYSWHGMGPWYHNVFDLLKQIAFDDEGSVFERALSRPIDFGVAPDEGKAVFDDSKSWMVDVRGMFRMTQLDRLCGAYLMIKTWTANRRSIERYSTLSAAEQWRKLLSPKAWSTFVSCFGPWIGSDWTHVSLHQAGLFFRRQLVTKPAHAHPADAEGPAWIQDARSGWLLLRGPSSEVWFDKWVRQLSESGVRFLFEETLHRFEFDGTRVTEAELVSGTRVHAALYVLATNPFAAADIVERNPALARLDQLCLFRPLVKGGPHTQVSFCIGFNETIRWPRKRCAVVLADSEFDLTIFAEEQVWAPGVELGAGVASLWTGTACVSSVPGRLYGLPLERCTKEQFIEEVKTQLLQCGSLDALIRDANNGRSLASFAFQKIEVWHEWTFSADGIRPRQPKWANTIYTQKFQPTQSTPLPNLLLAGAHTKTDADLWSIEAAVESGRRAAQVIEGDVVVLPQYRPTLLRFLGAVDDGLFAIHAPHVLDMILGAAVVAVSILLWVTLF